jgi:hypothetical protein
VIKQLICRYWYGGHWFKLCDDMGAAQCLVCGHLEDREYLLGSQPLFSLIADRRGLKAAQALPEAWSLAAVVRAQHQR